MATPLLSLKEAPAGHARGARLYPYVVRPRRRRRYVVQAERRAEGGEAETAPGRFVRQVEEGLRLLLEP